MLNVPDLKSPIVLRKDSNGAGLHVMIAKSNFFNMQIIRTSTMPICASKDKDSLKLLVSVLQHRTLLLAQILVRPFLSCVAHTTSRCTEFKLYLPSRICPASRSHRRYLLMLRSKSNGFASRPRLVLLHEPPVSRIWWSREQRVATLSER